MNNDDLKIFKNTEKHLISFKRYYAKRIVEARKKAAKTKKDVEAFSIKVEDGLAFAYFITSNMESSIRFFDDFHNNHVKYYCELRKLLLELEKEAC